MAAFEILVGTATIRGLIGEGRVHLIQSYQETSGEIGMCTIDQALATLVLQGQISMEEALMRCSHQGNLRKLVEQYAK